MAVLDDGKLIDALRERHDVQLVRFDTDLNRVAIAWQRTAGHGLRRRHDSRRRCSEQPTPRPTKPIAANDWQAALPAARQRDAAGPVAAHADHRRAHRRRFPAWWCSATAGRTPASIPPAPSPRHATPRFRSSPWASARIAARPTSASATWSRRPGPIRATAFKITGYLQSEGLADRTVARRIALAAGRRGERGRRRHAGSQSSASRSAAAAKSCR